MKNRTLLLSLLGLITLLAPGVLEAQQLSTVTSATIGPLTSREAAVQAQFPFGESGYALGTSVAYTEQEYDGVYWSDAPEKLPAGLIQIAAGTLSFQAPLFGILPVTTTVSTGVSGLDREAPNWNDPFGSVSFQTMFPLSERIVIVPVASYTLGAPYPVGTLIAQWQIGERYALQATVLSPALTLSFKPTEEIGLSLGVLYGSDGYLFPDGEEFSYSRLRVRNEVALQTTAGMTFSLFGEASLLQEIEYSDGAEDQRDSSDGVDASLGATIQVTI